MDDTRRSPTIHLADFVRDNLRRIVDTWAARAREVPALAALERPELEDHVPPMLHRVADIADALHAGREAPWPGDLAEKHARDRLRQGVPLSVLVRGYAILREVILQLWCDAGGSPLEDLAEVRVLNKAMDIALEASVDPFLTARMELLRALDQVSSAALESSSLDELLPRLLRIIIDATPTADTATILLREGDVLRVRSTIGLEEELAVGFSAPLGRGFAGRVGTERRPIEILDARTAATILSPALARRGIRGLYGVPLIGGDELLGVAHLGSLHASQFSDDEKRLFAILADRAASGIHQFRLVEATEQRARQQRAVSHFGLRALQARSLHEVYEDVAQTVAETLNVPLVEILEFKDGEESLLLTGGHGWTDGTVGHARVHSGKRSQAGYTLLLDAPVIADDLRTETRFEPPRLLVDHQAISGVTVAIRGQEGAACGVLGAHTRERRNFSPADADFLQAMANMVAAAMAQKREEARVRAAEDAQRFLADASRRFASSLEPRTTLTAVADLAIARLADWCTVDLLDSEGELHRVVVTHRDPEKAPLAEAIARRPVQPDAFHGPPAVVRTGEPQLLEHVSEAILRDVGRDEEQVRILQQLGLQSYLCVPITGRSGVIGAIGLATDGGRRPLRERDVPVALDLGRRAAIAIENARLYQAAQEAVRRREEVLGVVSHDLRNPLNAVRIGATILARTTTEEAVREHAARILRATGTMERFIQDLLDLASIEEGELALVLRDEDPHAILEDAVDRHAPLAREQRVTLKTREPGPLPKVRCDRERVLQVLGNLITNAIRATPQDGRIVVDAAPGDREVWISVADTGRGIPEEELAQVFDRYWRGKGAEYAGTGRGLAIAKGIVEGHGGRIEAESEVGTGSTFRFSLPAAD